MTPRDSFTLQCFPRSEGRRTSGSLRHHICTNNLAARRAPSIRKEIVFPRMIWLESSSFVPATISRISDGSPITNAAIATSATSSRTCATTGTAAKLRVAGAAVATAAAGDNTRVRRTCRPAPKSFRHRPLHTEDLAPKALAPAPRGQVLAPL